MHGYGTLDHRLFLVATELGNKFEVEHRSAIHVEPGPKDSFELEPSNSGTIL